jgi:carboxypeptidase Taq
MSDQLNEFKNKLAEVNDLDHANAVLAWDQSTYMPIGGAQARAKQMATLARISHEKFTSAEIGKLLDHLELYAQNLPPDSDDACLIRIARRDYERAIRVPSDFVAALTEHTIASYQLWAQARPANDFTLVRDSLERTLDFSRKLANFFPGYQHIADPLIDYADYGMKTSAIRILFDDLRDFLVPLVKKISEKEVIDDSILFGKFPADAQLEFGKRVIEKLGYDFQRGRQDLTHHPFTTKFSIGDVRITTRVQEEYLGDALFSTIHEAGHAMYEQGIRMDLDGSLLAKGTSSGVHESQSRLWENIVGRSREFWQYFYPELQGVFPDTLRDVPLETFYRAINRVQKSFIRVDADEVTYNLHVMLRFDLELQLLEGALEVKDLPAAWNARFEHDFGFAPPEDRLGVLQDVHWYAGTIGGAFQGYTLGNILSAQFYKQALLAYPDITDQIKQGEFKTLHQWLIDNIYQHGLKFSAPELIEKVTGGALDLAPYKEYLSTKYGDLYSL